MTAATHGNIECLLEHAEEARISQPPVGINVDVIAVLRYSLMNRDMTVKVANGSVKLDLEKQFKISYGEAGKIMRYLVKLGIIDLKKGINDQYELTEHYVLSQDSKERLRI